MTACPSLLPAPRLSQGLALQVPVAGSTRTCRPVGGSSPPALGLCPPPRSWNWRPPLTPSPLSGRLCTFSFHDPPAGDTCARSTGPPRPEMRARDSHLSPRQGASQSLSSTHGAQGRLPSPGGPGTPQTLRGRRTQPSPCGRKISTLVGSGRPGPAQTCRAGEMRAWPPFPHQHTALGPNQRWGFWARRTGCSVCCMLPLAGPRASFSHRKAPETPGLIAFACWVMAHR